MSSASPDYSWSISEIQSQGQILFGDNCRVFQWTTIYMRVIIAYLDLLAFVCSNCFGNCPLSIINIIIIVPTGRKLVSHLHVMYAPLLQVLLAPSRQLCCRPYYIVDDCY